MEANQDFNRRQYRCWEPNQDLNHKRYLSWKKQIRHSR
ncbi:hypothetical protein CCACVL1_15989 [Corchorus capsularis]|uniref:Uncharacterized protein n=1 Tax=Corchorus capsularis TaxID=210143 RepID=A0A1R3I014_COCAP|nr:hypothetical protein CCACVL1_15989 [Corchorus capsularis]